MYNITEIREVVELPSHLSEREHVSHYILNNSNNITSEAKSEEYQILADSNNYCTIFRVNNIEVWTKQNEFKYWLEILPKVKDNKIKAWYIAGSIRSIENKERASGVDGYKVHFIYNEKNS